MLVLLLVPALCNAWAKARATMSLNEPKISDREGKALRIARQPQLTRKGNVCGSCRRKPDTASLKYGPDPQAPRYTCRDYEFRNARGKHIVAVEYVLMREQTADGQTAVTATVKVTRKTYSQNWGTYNTAQQTEKPEVQALL